MRCDEMAEFVSAMCDGEAVPREAAEHVRDCVACRERLREYAEMGAELRVMASLGMDEGVRSREWPGRENGLANLWSRGWETMRVPKLAFAVLMVAVVGLASAFAVVQVKARSEGSVVLLKIAWPDGAVTPCALSFVDKMEATCSSLGPVNGKTVAYRIDLLGRKGDGVELALRTHTFGSSGGSLGHEESEKWTPRQVDFEPGQTLKLDFAGAGALTATGEWLDHMPLFLGVSTQDVQVGAEELRLVSPVLISGKQVLGDFAGGSATAVKDGQGVEVYLPGEGRFILSLSPMRGAVEATVSLNRITFEEGGRTYDFVTGSPVCRGEHLWVLHEAKFKGDLPTHPFVSAGDLGHLYPGV